MAKTKHNNLLDTIDEIITDGKNKGILHLYTEDNLFSGRKIQIKGKDLYHFGTTGYLGLEQDMRLKTAAVEAIYQYGTQFPLSKTYLSFGINKELEEHLYRMYQKPVLISKNSTLAHMAVIPTIVRDEDAVILDHQVHWSVQNACQMLKNRSIMVDMIRHSKLDMLEHKLREYGNKYAKVWYMIDGVYSMFGDFAPLSDLMALKEKYPSLHLYIDDVHGMSWAGKHGSGWVMSQFVELPENVVLTATLSKSFGASGSVTVFPDQEMLRKVKTFGGPLTFSAQLEPASVAAALASAKIHLSEEIYSMQEELAEKVAYCNSLLKVTDLPLIVENNCPVFFIGTGLPATGYNFVERIMKEGFYVNLGVFPAVPVKNTGVRFTISRHNQKEEIQGLVEAMRFHYTNTLAEEQRTHNEVRKKFNLPLIQNDLPEKPKSNLKLVHRRSIKDIDKSIWNECLGDKGIFDWNGMELLEEAFQHNPKPEDNWDFHYYLIYKDEELILATFFTTALWKEDMLAQAFVSKKVEEIRKSNPYYLTSKVISMGSLGSEGEHLFINRNNKLWKEAILLLLENVTVEQEKANASMVVLRDFIDGDDEVKEFLISQGFVKVTMPDTCIIENMAWAGEESYLNSLTSKSRRHIKTDVLKFMNQYEIEVKDKLSAEEEDLFYELYANVSANNYDLNIFKYPKKLLTCMSGNKNWEFLIFKIKDEVNPLNKKIIGFAATHKNAADGYTGFMMGINYEYLQTHKLYKQIIYQAVVRAKNVGAKKVYLGFSASIEKKKFGASVIPKIAYVQAKDNFNMELINTL